MGKEKQTLTSDIVIMIMHECDCDHTIKREGK
jgi:hypothetical protein